MWTKFETSLRSHRLFTVATTEFGPKRASLSAAPIPLNPDGDVPKSGYTAEGASTAIERASRPTSTLGFVGIGCDTGVNSCLLLYLIEYGSAGATLRRRRFSATPHHWTVLYRRQTAMRLPIQYDRLHGPTTPESPFQVSAETSTDS